MPTALITGLRGFTGKFLAQELIACGYSVCGTVFNQETSGPDEYSVDLCNLVEIRNLVNQVKPDFVVHLAAISFAAHGDSGVIYQTNVLGTRNLLQALSECNKPPQSILLASSANIYGNAIDDPIVELTEARPINDYAVSKLAMEYMARLWMDKLPIIMVRPFNYTGVGQAAKFLLPKVVSHFQRREKIIELGNLDIARDFSDVRMVVNIYRRLLNSRCVGETFNVCSGASICLKDVLSMMTDIAGYSINVKVNPAFVRANEIKVLRGDNSKLLKAIGAVDSIPLRDTLEWMYQGAII